MGSQDSLRCQSDLAFLDTCAVFDRKCGMFSGDALILLDGFR